ncbi:MAG: hypothetical protein IJS41_02485 [Clostridia bacterium]|nr:hypothetical protein [Clostridia bacterium]
MITFRFSGRQPAPRCCAIGQETDHETQTLRFFLPQISDGQTAHLMLLLPDGTPEILQIQDGLARVPHRLTDQPGRIRAWVEILGGDTLAWNSELFYLDVGDLPPISEQVEHKYPTAIQDALRAASDVEEMWASACQALADVQDMTSHMLYAAYYAGMNHDASAETALIPDLLAENSYALAQENGFTGTEDDWQEYLERVGSLSLVHRFVTPQMFGAKCDGVSDDTVPMRLAAMLAKHFNVPLVCHGGTIYLKSATENTCPEIATDVDFSGSTLLMDGQNAGQVILKIGGDPESLSIEGVTHANFDSVFSQYPNSVISVTSGLSLGARQGNPGSYYHKQTFLTDDYGVIQPLDLFLDIQSVRECVRVDKLTAPIRVRLGTILVKDAGYPAEILIQRSNVTVCDTAVHTENISGMAWHNGLFTAKYGFNIAFENIVGNNVANLPSGTSTVTEYLFDVYSCYQVLFDRLHFSKEWGAAATHWCADVTYRNCECNRADFHYGVYGNNLVENCRFFGYPGVVSIGYGDGTVAVKHCAFWKRAEGALYDNSVITFRADFAIMFSGTLIAEDNTVHLHDRVNANYVWFITYHAWAENSGGFLSIAPTSFPTVRAKRNILKTEDSANTDKLSALRLSNGTTTTITVGQIDLGFDNMDLQTAVNTDFSGFGTSNAILRLENTRFAGSAFAGLIEADRFSTINAPLASVRRLFAPLQAMQCGLVTVSFTADETQTATADVTFATPFPDTNYTVSLAVKGGDGRYRVLPSYENKLKSGFRVYAIADNNTAFTDDRTVEISWLCVAESA